MSSAALKSGEGGAIRPRLAGWLSRRRAAESPEESASPASELPAMNLGSTAAEVDLAKPASGTDDVPTLALRVLTGVQKGAQAPMSQQRLLVGNLQAECDVVLDVGSPLPHTCLVRASHDGWTVLCIAGNLWVGEKWLAPQQVRDIVSGTVLTLGEVSFCVADSTTTDWALVALPAEREMPPVSEPMVAKRPTAATSSAAARKAVKREVPPARPRLVQTLRSFLPGRRSLATAGMVSLGFLALTGLGVSLYAASASSETVAIASSRSADSARAAVKDFAWARELTMQPDPRRAHHVLVTGYLPERHQAGALQAALHRQGIEPENRWVAVDELGADLSRRLGLPDSKPQDDVRYSGQGSFRVIDSGEHFDALHRLVQRALQDVPALHAIELQMPDRSGDAGDRSGVDRSAAVADSTAQQRPPIVIRYDRAEGAPSGVVVTGLDQLRPAQELQRLEVNEVRTGKLPSIVLDNGTRYFEGSTLPGGAVLVSVLADHLMVRTGEDVRRIELDTGAPIVVKRPARSARIADARRAAAATRPDATE